MTIFQYCKLITPCILFLDHVEILGKKRSLDQTDERYSYWMQQRMRLEHSIDYWVHCLQKWMDCIQMYILNDSIMNIVFLFIEIDCHRCHFFSWTCGFCIAETRKAWNTHHNWAVVFWATKRNYHVIFSSENEFSRYSIKEIKQYLDPTIAIDDLIQSLVERTDEYRVNDIISIFQRAKYDAFKHCHDNPVIRQENIDGNVFRVSHDPEVSE